MLCNRLSLTTPQPRPYRFADGIDGTFQRLDDSLRFAHWIRDWSESHLRQGSAVAGLIDVRSQTLETDLDALRYELHEMGSSIVNGVPTYIGELLERIKRCVAELTELVDFYGQNREQGRSDALDALFASQFILDIDERTGYPRSLPNQQGLVQMAISIAETLGKTSLNGASLVPQMEAVQSFEEHRPHLERCLFQFARMLEPRYVHTYNKTEDVPYEQKAFEPIAKGSFGAVVRVEHKKTSEELAMKTFFCNDRSKILQEIGVLEVCNHPNIVKLVEAFTVANDERYEEDNGIIHLILRPWAPYTLEDFLKSTDGKRKDRCKWFSPGSPQSGLCIYRIMKKLAQAVASMHGRSIKHKDIKPDNILLHEPNSPNIRPLLTDVGVSKVFIRGGSTNFDDCSYIFLAPEQVARLESNLRADIWQLGCCFALMLGVAKRGRAGRDELWDSFCRTKDRRSCQIASEHEHFMKSLKVLCDESLSRREALSSQLAYELVSGMLDKNHETRLEIHQVLSRLDQLVAQMSTVSVGDVEMSYL
ncbi:serine/threonine protein kinase [Fusarium oxysporum f. sp. lycopersici 4287]|uniref:Serine/threonine protein kinase n=3 Tax=Fusarium oxysporum TaxID=5507 RepID=A0A0J9WJW8_FUSO4|nr:serine/threonine protein kinase [Fusarium oxysporum f. sp. lycopersici 4287]EXK43905.1 serine/threonine protein kinase [Fusarium oxysporum f. sp. melonis 26406]KAJ9427519.1 serine/threonine protein kinase [Fusarium oxysporum]KNB01007.1 serine/threonine protein kinase [Fusarium oxysporum f. sp. lycopersici 4287]